MTIIILMRDSIKDGNEPLSFHPGINTNDNAGPGTRDIDVDPSSLAHHIADPRPVEAHQDVPCVKHMTSHTRRG